MITILIVFDISCVLRGVLDKVMAEQMYQQRKYSMAVIVCLIFSAILLDFVPITMTLIFHSLNFKSINTGPDSMSLKSPESQKMIFPPGMEDDNE